MALNFNQFATEGNTFLNNYTEQLHLGEDTEKAGRILSAILHALREIIPVEESLQFIAQLPMFLKAAYVNGWTIKEEKPNVRRMEDFVKLVKHYGGLSAVNDFGRSDVLAEKYIDTTLELLKEYVSIGQMEDIRDTLPRDLKSMIQTN